MGIGSWFQKTKDKVVDDIIPKELTSGEEFKKQLRNIIPNELADVAVKAAPFVAPFSPETAAAMRAFGRFDQRGSISDALKQGAMMYVGGKGVGMIPGTGNYFGKGFEGAKALGSDALSGITSIFKGGSTPGTNEIVQSMTGDAAIAEQIALEGAKEKAKESMIRKGLGSVKDFGLEYLLGDDKKFQMGDIGRFLGDPGKTIPLTMLATYIKEKFFPDEDTNSPDARYAQAMKRRGEDVEKYLREYGPIDFRRDPSVNPYTDEEIEDFVTTNLAEYQGYEDGGRVEYGLGSMIKRSSVAEPMEALIREEKERRPMGKVDPEIVLQLFKEKFKDGFGSGRGRPLPKVLPRKISNTVTAEDIEEVIKQPMSPRSFNFPMTRNNRRGLGKLIMSALEDANFDRFRAARGGDTPQENAMQAAGIEGLDINVNPKGVKELDMRETGGFIPPVGVKEKADDIPAMLSNNEFVFTADAVRAAGGGSVDKGAQRMYKMMKDLEAQV